MGLGFSTSSETVRVRSYDIISDETIEVVKPLKNEGEEEAEEERQKEKEKMVEYTFSDGVGLVAESLAQKVSASSAFCIVHCTL